MRVPVGDRAGLTSVHARTIGSVRFGRAGKTRFAGFATDGRIVLALPDAFDPRCGTIRFRICPSWPGDDGKRHAFVHMQRGRAHFTIFKTEGGTLRFVYRGAEDVWAGTDAPVRDWTPGRWYPVEAGWQPLPGGRLLLVLWVGGRTHFSAGAVPFETAPDQLMLGGRGLRAEPAQAKIADFEIADTCEVRLPIPVGPKPPVRARIDLSEKIRPFRPVHDFVTIWNSRKNPVPFEKGDPVWRRFVEARFGLARLVAVSETWLWGVAVTRGEDGRLAYDAGDLDRLVDVVRSAGAEVYLRIAYHTPEALRTPASTQGSRNTVKKRLYAMPQRIEEWRQTVRWILRHFRKRGVPLPWVVASLNEADIAVRRGQADWNEVCRLYVDTARLVREESPESRIGGPALAADVRFDGGQYLRRFAERCAKETAPLDFVCIHAYAKPFPSDYEEIVNTARRIVEEAYPAAPAPAIVVDEFNLWARDHRQDDHYGAAYITAAEHFMRRAGAAKVSLVSFNHFLPLYRPGRTLLVRRGPFDKSPGQPARFLVRSLTAADTTMPGILAHPPRAPDPGIEAYTFGTWRVTLPAFPAVYLVFHTGIAIRPFPRMDGATFRVVIRDEDGEHVVFEEHQRKPAWRKHSVDLSRFAGKDVSIEFRTSAGPPGSNGVADWASWGRPRLVTKNPGADERVFFDFAAKIAEAEAGIRIPEYRFRYGDDAIMRYIGLPLIKGTVVTAPWFALYLHSMLRGHEPAVEMPGQGGIMPDRTAGVTATVDRNGTAAILVWCFDPFAEDAQKRKFELTVTGCPPGRPLVIERWLIDSTHTNPYRDYVIAKKPDNGGRYNLEDGKPDLVESRRALVGADGAMRLSFMLEPRAVSLVRLSSALRD